VGELSALSTIDEIQFRKNIELGCYVYVIQAGEYGPVKIGFTANPFARLSELQTGNPFPLRVVAAEFIGDRRSASELESIIHNKLSEFRLKGEWFAFNEQVREFVSCWVNGASFYCLVS